MPALDGPLQVNIGAQQVNLSPDARERRLAALGLTPEAVAQAGAGDLSHLPAWLKGPSNPDASPAPDPDADRLDVNDLAEVAHLVQALARPNARLKKRLVDAEAEP